VARIRSVKPELRDSRIVQTWPFEVRYFWVLFWGYLDDFGRGHDMPKRIAGDCFPNDDVTAQDIDKWLDLMTHGIDERPAPVCRYEVAGSRYIHAVNWSEHQKPNRPTKSRIPKCPLHEPLSEDDSEPLNGNAVLGAAAAAEQGSRGAAAPAREPVTELAPGTDQAARLIVDAAYVDPALAIEAAQLIARERKHRNLPGLVSSIITAGELGQWLPKAEAALQKRAVAAAQAAARASPPCAHGVPGGDQLHPVSHEPFCPQCRREARA
jgi:hypothetical protein